MLLAAVNVDLREWVDYADMEKKISIAAVWFYCETPTLLQLIQSTNSVAWHYTVSS